MGKLRLDIVNHKKVRVLQVTEKVHNGAFGMIGALKNVDDLGRETYVLEKFKANAYKYGQVVFVADDGHRYHDVRMTSTPSLMRKANPQKPYFEVENDGFDIVVDPAEEQGITRGYGTEPFDVISVEPHVLLGGEPCRTIEEAKSRVGVGKLLQPRIGSYCLEVTTNANTAIAVVDGIELYSGYPVVVIRFI